MLSMKNPGFFFAKMSIFNQMWLFVEISHPTKKNYYIPLRFGKAGSVWCGGARETH